MKIYFDGNSWTAGSEVKGYTDHEGQDSEYRWSKILCGKLGAEECNVAGSPNDRIVRNLLINYNIEEYDLAIIQMSTPGDREQYIPRLKDWRKIGIYNTPVWGEISGKGKKNRKPNHWSDDDAKFWEHYYREIYNDYYGATMEKIHCTAVRNHCKVHGVPVLILVHQGFTYTSKLDYDFDLNQDKYPRWEHNNLPNKEGHKMIAEDLYALIQRRQFLLGV